MKTYFKDENGNLRYFDTLTSIIDADNEYWSCFKNRMGFNPETNPLPVIIDAPIESTHQFVVRGGRGRWNSIDFPDAAFTNGSHLFEGWDAQEKYRLSMLIGKYAQGTANIFTFMPSYNGDEAFGTINIGCDKNYKGVDFTAEKMTTHAKIIIPHYSSISSLLDYLQLSIYGGTDGKGASIVLHGGGKQTNASSIDMIIGKNRTKDYEDTTKFNVQYYNTDSNQIDLFTITKNLAKMNVCLKIANISKTSVTAEDNGTIWYDNTEHKYKGVVDGVVKSFVME